jgi:hypothetical protein
VGETLPCGERLKFRLIACKLFADKENMKRKIHMILFLLSALLFPLAADQFYIPEGDYHINVPVRWDLYDASDAREISFIADDQSTIVQVSWFEGDQFDDVDNMCRYFADGVGAELHDQSLFSYLDWQSLLADMSFESGGNLFRGWFLFLEGDEYDYQVIVFSPEGDFERAFPYILSCLDSFSPGEVALRNPGVISRLFYAEENASYEKKTAYIQGKAFVYDFDPFELEASQVVIEREAPLLTKFTKSSPESELAWDRYYKLVYRDNYHRLDPVYEALRPCLDPLSDREKAETLLDWLQGFEYGSSGTFSDLLSPLTSLVRNEGDCDSLALAYLILLEHFDIEGILLVSQEYAHAMAGVLVDRGGFTFPYGDKNYVFAELTKNVEMGMIASGMTDPAKWQPISFTE